MSAARRPWTVEFPEQEDIALIRDADGEKVMEIIIGLVSTTDLEFMLSRINQGE